MSAQRSRLLRIAGLGFVLWLFASWLGYFGDVASQLVALGAATVVPLGIAASASDAYPSTTLARLALGFVAIGSPLALASFLFPRGAAANALALAWLLATLVSAAWALGRIARRGFLPIEELAIDMGHLYLPVGAVWLTASRGGHELLGFREPVVTFTAAHFHFAGFAAPVIAGLMGRALGLRRHPSRPTHGIAEGHWPKLARASIVVVILGVPLVAAGIQFSRHLEAPAAILLGAGMLGTGACLAKIAWGRVRAKGFGEFITGVLLFISSASLVLSMSFAVLFTTTGSTTQGAAEPLIPFATMLRYHGIVNVFGFAMAALLAFTFVEAAPRFVLPDVRWPKLAAKGFVGHDYFERIGAIDDSYEVLGQIGSLRDIGGRDLDVDKVHPAVRRFYESTSRFGLVVTPDWQPLFRMSGRLFAKLARRLLGNLELPTEPEVADGITTRIFPLRASVDGRLGARGYVRSYTGSEGTRANYVASYATIDAGSRIHLAAAFPLPFACLVAILRFDPGPNEGLMVTSSPRPEEGPAGEGIYLSTPLGVLRLPMNERVEVWPKAGSAELVAKHELRVFGVLAFRLHYAITEVAESPETAKGRTSPAASTQAPITGPRLS